MKRFLPFITFLGLLIIGGVASWHFVKADEQLGEGFSTAVRQPVFFVRTTSTADILIATSTFIVNNTPTTTFSYGRFYVDKDGNVSASGTFKVFGVTTLAGGIAGPLEGLSYLSVTDGLTTSTIRA